MGKAKALNPEDLWDLPYSDEASSVSQVCWSARAADKLPCCTEAGLYSNHALTGSIDLHNSPILMHDSLCLLLLAHKQQMTRHVVTLLDRHQSSQLPIALSHAADVCCIQQKSLQHYIAEPNFWNAGLWGYIEQDSQFDDGTARHRVESHVETAWQDLHDCWVHQAGAWLCHVSWALCAGAAAHLLGEGRHRM